MSSEQLINLGRDLTAVSLVGYNYKELKRKKKRPVRQALTNIVGASLIRSI